MALTCLWPFGVRHPVCLDRSPGLVQRVASQVLPGDKDKHLEVVISARRALGELGELGGQMVQQAVRDACHARASGECAVQDQGRW